jgi:periplasmic protein TonB
MPFEITKMLIFKLFSMIAKKNPRYDLERKRTALFFTGLLTAGSFTLAAFTYRSPVDDDQKRQRVAGLEIGFQVEEKVEIPKDDPIIKPLIQQSETSASSNQINIDQQAGELINQTGNNDGEIDPNVGLTGSFSTGEFDAGIVDIDTDEEYEIVDVDAQFMGGYEEMLRFIHSNLVYPQDAIEMNEQGKVYVTFVVEKDGSLSNIAIARGVYQSLDREASRIVRKMPKWVPGEVKYQKVRTRMMLPINFVLQ